MDAVSIIKYVLGSVYILPGLYGLTMFIREFTITKTPNPTIRERCKFSTRKVFFLVVTLHQFVRAFFFFLPLSVYSKMARLPHYVALFNVLDLFSEFLFFLTYSLLLISWMQTFHKAQALDKVKCCRFISIPVISSVVIFTFASVTIIVMTICIIRLNLEYSVVQTVQGSILCAVTCLATILFLSYSFLLYFRLKKSKYRVLIQDQIRKSMNRLKYMALVYLIFLSIHSLYILLLGDLLFKLRENGKLSIDGYAVIWGGYFVVAEELPLITILFILSIPSFKKKKELIKQELIYQTKDEAAEKSEEEQYDLFEAKSDNKEIIP